MAFFHMQVEKWTKISENKVMLATKAE